MQVVLLEKIEKLGSLGEVVTVKPGYARNFLIPQKKALRATQDNLAYFEAQKAQIEKANEERKKEAEKIAKDIDGKFFVLIRQASEGGQLYGSVSARDISDIINEGKTAVKRSQVVLNQAIKTNGLFEVEVAVHAEVKITVTVNIARSEEEAAIQEKTGEAVVQGDENKGPVSEAKADEAAEAAKEELLDEDALKAEQAAAEAEAQAEAEEAATEATAETEEVEVAEVVEEEAEEKKEA